MYKGNIMTSSKLPAKQMKETIHWLTKSRYEEEFRLLKSYRGIKQLILIIFTMFTMYRSFLEIFSSFTTLYMSVTDPKLQCPSHYPVGCLLGCVDLTDCLAQDEYREKVGTAYHALMETCFLVNS